ncbi:hypothetical protein ONE63_009157 [Megalurothrips usitatus]|uniref:F-box domain-containing protein n=1 Tax=Megalurothrips usitatus TaxID=439358 RepID=A0AAV7XQE2_9NEOP|nr:hypothetical protein ONE63_009157 [Megalurothrips usitatus]
MYFLIFQTIEDLFDELLQKIFSYLPAQDVWAKSKVCLRWERVAKDPVTLNQTQLFVDEKADDELYADVLRDAPCIGEVYILPPHPPNALNLLINGPKVRKLVIVGDSDWHRNWPSPADLIALLSHNKHTLQQLTGMKRLTSLFLVGECWRDWDEWDLSQGFPHLWTLKIDSLSFISEECPFIRDLIMLCKPTLRTLHLPCQLPHDAVSLLNAGVFQGSLVEELTVSTGCLRVVSQMPHLKILAVADNGKEDRDLSWFKNTPMLSGVWKLTLQSILETENETQGFVWHLLSKFNHVLEFWGLESSVEENTFNMFLRNNSLLREIHFLDFVGFDNPNQVVLLENYLPNLCRLDLALSQISEEMSAALHSFNERKPDLKIVFDNEYDETEIIMAPE